MTAYFNSLSLGAEVIEYVTEDGADWLLTSAISGEDCTHAEYLSDPKRLARTTGTLLRALHEIKPENCPAKNRVAEYLALAEANYQSGNYDKSNFPDSFGYRSAEEAYEVLSSGKHLLKSDTLIHGDYCLPNVILNDWKLSAFIDVDHGGIGDRHIDLFWGAWTLWFNLKTDKYRDLFFDAYGRDKINRDVLSVVAAAEVFG
jgi:kanamycin kinase